MKKVSAAQRRRWPLTAALATVIVAGGITAGVTTTSAEYRDPANLNMGSRGIGSAERFDIALVQDGTVRQADREGLVWELGADTQHVVPGTVVESVVPVINNGPYRAEIGVRVEDLYDESQDGGSDPFSLYRWTVVDDETGEVLAGDGDDPLASTVTGEGLGEALEPFVLEARGSAGLADGDEYVPGADGSARRLRVIVAYPDTPESESYNGGASRMRLVFDAESAS